jgi:hypothetical protein
MTSAWVLLGLATPKREHILRPLSRRRDARFVAPGSLLLTTVTSQPRLKKSGKNGSLNKATCHQAAHVLRRQHLARFLVKAPIENAKALQRMLAGVL